MNTSTPGDTADNLKEEGRDILDRLKEAAKDKVIDPAIEAGKHFSEAAREGAGRVADFSRRAVHSTDEWVDSHSYSTAGLSFFVGIAVGFVVGRHLR